MRVCLVGGIFGSSPAHRARHPHAPEVLLADGLARLGVEVERTGHDRFRPDGRWDVIHVHHVGRAAYLAAVSRTRAPFVFTGHDGQMLCGYGNGRLRRSAFRFVVRRADAAVALGPDEATFLRGLGQPRVEVIPNGIAPVFGRVALDRERRGILYVGQLLPLKGVDVLLRALALLRRHAGEPLTLAYHNGALEPGLRALARELGLGGRVRFAGALSPGELAERYATSRALVLPSHAESLPSVVSEALLAGTPVVASRVGGIPAQLGPHGRLVPPGDPAALATALEHVLDHPPDARQREAMRGWATGRFGVTAMAARHAAFYASLLAGAPRPRGTWREPLAPALRLAIAAYWGPALPAERTLG